jgi:hypothetical protein
VKKVWRRSGVVDFRVLRYGGLLEGQSREGDLFFLVRPEIYRGSGVYMISLDLGSCIQLLFGFSNFEGRTGHRKNQLVI